jgi:ABC-type uncharacterized transport system fused permease/ATPase subunit
LFAIISKYRGYGRLDPETAFTATALLVMVTHPANMIMTIIPQAIASLANFERVHQYLIEGSRQDLRLEIKTTATLPRGVAEDGMPAAHAPAIIVEKLAIQHSETPQATLRDISFQVNAGSVVMCSGAVGAGKTTLARAFLGDISPSSGSISIMTKRIGLCAQTPWLPSGTIRQVICGTAAQSSFDLVWYEVRIFKANYSN